MNDWIDISSDNKNGMVVWPGDPAFSLQKIYDIAKGDALNLSLVTMTTHTGTHIDAPLHWIRDGKSIDEMPISMTSGAARLIEIKDPESITVEELKLHSLKKGERVLFKTRNRQNPSSADYVYLSLDAARFIARTGLLAVGVDTLSVGDGRDDGRLVHTALLEAGVWIIEGLDLSQVEAGEYELICLPLKLTGADGAPSRAVLRKLSPG